MTVMPVIQFLIIQFISITWAAIRLNLTEQGYSHLSARNRYYCCSFTLSASPSPLLISITTIHSEALVLLDYHCTTWQRISSMSDMTGLNNYGTTILRIINSFINIIIIIIIMFNSFIFILVSTRSVIN